MAEELSVAVAALEEEVERLKGEMEEKWGELAPGLAAIVDYAQPERLEGLVRMFRELAERAEARRRSLPGI
jgi:hypothetical protein